MTGAAEPRFARALPALLVLALSCTLSFALLGSFATVQEAAKAELRLSDYALSMVTGVSAAIPLLLLSIPIGIAVDRFHRVRILLALALVWTAGTALTALAGGFWLLFVARMMTAIGMSGALTAALSIAADLCAPDQRGRANLIINMGKIVGQAAGFALAGGLFAWFATPGAPGWFGAMPAWRTTHLALAAIGGLLLLPLLLLREPPRSEIEAGPHAPLATVARELWARRAFLGPLFAGQMSIVMADAAAVIWAAPVLTRQYGLQPGAFAAWLGALIIVAGLLGSVAGGIGADRGFRSGRRGGLMLSATIAAAIGIPAALFPIAGSVPLFALILGIFAAAGAVTGLVMAVALTVYLPNELRGLTIGAFIALAGLFGFGAAPLLVAYTSDLMGGERHLAPALALVGVVTSIVGFGGFWLAMRRAPII